MDVDGILVMTYPPGYLFHKKRFNFKMRSNFPKELGLNGLFGSPWVKEQRKLRLKREAKATTDEHVTDEPTELTPLSEELQGRVIRCTPHLAPAKCLELMNHNTEKHGPNIEFLTLDDYPEFTVGIFEMYSFNRLLSFVVTEIFRGVTPIWKYSYLREDWIGIRLADFKTTAENYPPIAEVGPKSKLSFRLIPSMMAEDVFFLHGVHVGVTKNRRLKCGGPTCIVLEDDTEVPSPESIVLLSDVLEF